MNDTKPPEITVDPQPIMPDADPGRISFKKQLLFTFIAFSGGDAVFYLISITGSVLYVYRHEALGVLAGHFYSGRVGQHLLQALFLFPLGLLVNVAIRFVSLKAKSFRVMVFIITPLVLIALEQLVQLSLMSSTEHVRFTLLGGWFAFDPQPVAEGGRKYVSMAQFPRIRLPVLIFGGFYFPAFFRLLNGFCKRKSSLFASALFLFAGFWCSAFVSLLHGNMVYDYIKIGNFIINIMDIYVLTGAFLFFQAYLENYKILKKVKTKEVIAFFRNDFKNIKTTFADFLKRTRAGRKS